jgi:hypothetical protein
VALGLGPGLGLAAEPPWIVHRAEVLGMADEIASEIGGITWSLGARRESSTTCTAGVRPKVVSTYCFGSPAGTLATFQSTLSKVTHWLLGALPVTPQRSETVTGSPHAAVPCASVSRFFAVPT